MHRAPGRNMQYMFATKACARKQSKVQPKLHAKCKLHLDCLEVKASTKSKQTISNPATGHSDMTPSDSCCYYGLVPFFCCPQVSQLRLQMTLCHPSRVQLLLNKLRRLDRHCHFIQRLQIMKQNSIMRHICSHCSCMCHSPLHFRVLQQLQRQILPPEACQLWLPAELWS